MEFKCMLVTVTDMERARKFYEDIFGLELLQDNDGNMLLSGGVALQRKDIWEKFLGRDVLPKSNASELYFEDPDVEGLVARVEQLYPETEFVNRLMTHTWGQTVTRFYDPDGNLIEVGTPVAGN